GRSRRAPPRSGGPSASSPAATAEATSWSSCRRSEAMAAPVRVVIADDHALFRQGLKSMLKLRQRVSIVGDVERGADIGPVLAKTPCDVLLLDLRMDRNALSEITGLSRRVRVVVVTASEQPAEALAALRAGARAVVFKRFAIETLMDAIHAVMEGHV